MVEGRDQTQKGVCGWEYRVEVVSREEMPDSREERAEGRA